MRIRNLTQLNDFVGAVDNCKGDVWLESPAGDKYNLKSSFSQYLALGKLLEEQGDFLELFCLLPDDEANFYQFFKEHPEVQK